MYEAQVFTTIELFLISVGIIALVVYGVGIMNMMLMSHLERTKEIGTLKALGIKDRTVLLTFLLEASFIGVIGSAVGALFGFGLADILATYIKNTSVMQTLETGTTHFHNINIVPDISSIMQLGAILFPLLVSITFALHPAWRASRLDPVDALRFG